MDATTYTGNGASNRTIVNAGGFRPDLAWVKARNFSSSHGWGDSVRGNGNVLRSDNNLAEMTGRVDILNGFASNGFIVGGDGISNGNGNTYVGWQWQSGQGTTSSNTNGSITSTVSVNATAGFSIVTYLGANSNTSTVGHGLGVAPAMIIIKSRLGSGSEWRIYHKTLGNTASLSLNSTAASQTALNFWNSTSPTSSVFTVSYISGANGDVNYSGGSYVAYCWAEIAGFSKFGSYVGNGSTDGTFVYLGFRPKYILLKGTNVTQWIVEDASRSPNNVSTIALFPNLADAEQTNRSYIDFLSNGFKLRDSNADSNASGVTYIYMAFAENPFKNANAR
jgi:hypothetical protein